MVPWPNLAAFALASVILIAIPGPTMLFVVGRSLVLGRRGGLLSVVGNTLGLLPHLVAVAVGVGALVTASAGVLAVIKLAGAAYLIFLGVQAIRHRSVVTAGPVIAELNRSHLLGQGFLVGVSNPKAIVFFAAVLPQFVAYEHGLVWLQMLVLGATFAVIALLGDSAWVLLAGLVRDWFATSPRRTARLRGLGGGLMIALGGGLAATSASHNSAP